MPVKPVWPKLLAENFYPQGHGYPPGTVSQPYALELVYGNPSTFVVNNSTVLSSKIFTLTEPT